MTTVLCVPLIERIRKSHNPSANFLVNNTAYVRRLVHHDVRLLKVILIGNLVQRAVLVVHHALSYLLFIFT